MNHHYTFKACQNFLNMIVINSGELRRNLKKYLDMADKERVIIQRGKTETFELRKRERISDDPYFDDPKNIEAIEKGYKILDQVNSRN